MPHAHPCQSRAPGSWRSPSLLPRGGHPEASRPVPGGGEQPGPPGHTCRRLPTCGHPGKPAASPRRPCHQGHRSGQPHPRQEGKAGLRGVWSKACVKVAVRPLSRSQIVHDEVGRSLVCRTGLVSMLGASPWRPRAVTLLCSLGLWAAVLLPRWLLRAVWLWPPSLPV